MRKQIFFVVFLCLGIWGIIFGQTAAINSPNLLKGVTKTVENGNLVIQFEGTSPIVNYTFYDYPPDKFVIDIPDIDISAVEKTLNINTLGVGSIKLEPISNSKDKPLVQVEIEKTSLSKCLVTAEGNSLFVKVVVEEGKGSDTQVREQAKFSESEVLSEAPGKNVEQTSIIPVEEKLEPAKILKGLKILDEGKSVKIVTDGAVEYKYFVLKNPERFVIDLKGVSKSIVPSKVEGMGIIAQVRTNLFKADPPVMRVVLDLTQENASFKVIKMANIVFATANENIAEFNKQEVSELKEFAEIKPVEEQAMLGKKQSLQIQQEVEPAKVGIDNQTVKSELKKAELEDVSVELKPIHQGSTSEFKGYEDLFVAQNSAVEASEAKVAAQPIVPLSFKEKTIAGQEVKYSGQPISLSLKDADVKDVLRLFHDVSKLNIVVHPSVMGKVTIDLENVPWDQAMDIVLKNNGLDYIYENNVIWVAPAAEISRKFSERQKLEEDKLNAEPPVTFTKRLSYAKADQMRTILNKFLTSKGDIYTDKRTNTVIIKEVPSRKDGIVKLLETLDAPTPQVLIEARIVESTVSWRSQFGISWGGGSSGTPNNLPNNTTGFPNWFTGDFAVNLPPPASNGFIDLVFGNLAGTFNLDVRLSSLENTGRGRVISAPKVVTQDNEKASIESGRQIPVPIATADKVSVMYINATLKLDVTPHITADGNVNMDIDITNDSVDFQNQQPNSPPPIFKKEAKTVLKVRDGQTAVIGGIFVTSEGISQQGLPFFSRIPVLGWLFKNRTKNRDNSELLIFLTPKIIR